MACITLLSDLGLQDASVGSIKGILMQHVPQLPVIDISHDILPYHLQQAAYMLNASYNNFPTGSFHIILCDVLYKTDPRIILCAKHGHYFLGPDNGILALALDTDGTTTWECISSAPNLYTVTAKVGDIIARLSSDEGPDTLGLVTCDMYNPLQYWTPKLTGNAVECHVMHIDRFENVILNITKRQFEEYSRGRSFTIEFYMDSITILSNHYTDVRKGELLARFNSAGYLEIAINRDKAASLLGLKLNKDQHLTYKPIKIIFE